jgi:hypothetical protein
LKPLLTGFNAVRTVTFAGVKIIVKISMGNTVCGINWLGIDSSASSRRLVKAGRLCYLGTIDVYFGELAVEN